ncbi:hypothetical protein TCAL_16794 [Tigriopus californicus]|uniref:N-acetyltransferase ESCO acetyl-transferase domain-containing protein n=1 Tax=Tigriopus californicus TaxID=6832 RepID=A0A553PCL8_TIGCA|nr:hypothetical protein TCAL_16794 [Tigriopus californicus]
MSSRLVGVMATPTRDQRRQRSISPSSILSPSPRNRKRSVATEPRPTAGPSRLKRPTKAKRSIFGLNKGVNHAIKKPKPVKTPAVKTEKSPKPEKTPKPCKPMFKVAPGLTGTLSSSVNFVVKNGQYQFLRRRSPRKSPSKVCYLNNVAALVGSPVVRRTPRLFSPSSHQDYLQPHGPSPGKASRFIPSPVRHSPVKFDKEDEDIAQDVSGILESLDEAEPEDRSSDYVEYVDEDELNQVAWDAVNEIESLNYEVGMATGVVNGELDTLRYDDESSNDTLLRTPKKNALASPLNLTPRQSDRKGTPQKDDFVTPLKKPSTPRRSTRNTPNKENDDHKYLGIVAFPGWKVERCVFEDPINDSKILYVKTKDPKRHWDKVKAVLEVVDEFLGVSQSGLRQESRSEALLYVLGKRVIGFLLAEPLLETDQLSKSFFKQDSRVVQDLQLNGSSRRKLCGVSRIWVHEEHQRQGIATKLMDCLRSQYHLPMVMQKNMLALSHTSEMGSAFATKYFGSSKFLVYRPGPNT